MFNKKTVTQLTMVVIISGDNEKPWNCHDSWRFTFITWGASWADQHDALESIKMKSTLGWFLRYRNCLVAFGCKTSDRICGSSTEAECMAIVEFARMNTFVRRFVQDICWSVDLTPTLVLEDIMQLLPSPRKTQK